VPSSKVKYTFPVGGKTSYAHTHHDYPASDMIAACGLPVLAATSGVVLEVTRVDKYVPAKPVAAERGGISVSLLGDDGVRYYGSHLSSIKAGIDPGVRVASGAQLGLVGTTGNSSACHLHFGISPACQKTGDWWVRRGEVYPWSYLDAWRAGQMKSPVAEVTAWQRAHGCPASAPAGT
jgi:murein DD-endopeptidase MepM/ murein hydrolase activator NlpD